MKNVVSIELYKCERIRTHRQPMWINFSWSTQVHHTNSTQGLVLCMKAMKLTRIYYIQQISWQKDFKEILDIRNDRLEQIESIWRIEKVHFSHIPICGVGRDFDTKMWVFCLWSWFVMKILVLPQCVCARNEHWKWPLRTWCYVCHLWYNSNCSFYCLIKSGRRSQIFHERL